MRTSFLQSGTDYGLQIHPEKDERKPRPKEEEEEMLLKLSACIDLCVSVFVRLGRPSVCGSVMYTVFQPMFFSSRDNEFGAPIKRPHLSSKVDLDTFMFFGTKRDFENEKQRRLCSRTLLLRSLQKKSFFCSA